MVNGGSIVVDYHKLVDASKLSNQSLTEQRLNLADQVLRTHQLTAASWLGSFRVCRKNNNLRVCYCITVMRVFVRALDVNKTLKHVTVHRMLQRS